jgi:hypothetical protein
MSLTRIRNFKSKAKHKPASNYYYLIWRRLPAVVLFFLAIYIIAPRTSKKGTTFSSESTKDIFQLINNTCSTMPFSAPNKPEGMIVNSMFSLEDFGSLDDPKVKKYFTTPELLTRERNKDNNNRSPMLTKTMNDALAVFTKHDAAKPYDIKVIYSNYVSRLGNLKKLYLKQAYANKIKMGFCGEHSAHTVYALLQLSIKKQVNIPIKTVEAAHSYVTIGSELVDVSIEYDDNAVHRYVTRAEKNKHFSRGYLCDSWNEGFFAKASTNTVALYKASDIREHEVSVVTYSLDFDLSLFSAETAAYLKEELQAIGLESLHGRPVLDVATYDTAAAVEEDKTEVRGLRLR